MNRLVVLLSWVWLPFICAGCSDGGAGSGASAGGEAEAAVRSYPINIITTCGMVTDIVVVVAGDKGQVTGLMGEGVDPHLYKPTRNDAVQLKGADVVFYSGLMLEGRMADSFTQVARRGKPVYPVTEQIDQSFLREPPKFEGHWDPHVWMDVSAWSQCVAQVARALAEFDPDNADYYQRNASEYREKLRELHEYARQRIATVPKQQRVLVTAHDAFGYFADAYEIEVRSPQGLSTESEPALKDITELVDFIVERKIPAIFIESSVSKESILAIVEGARDKGWEVKTGGELYSDAMGPAGTYEGTYLGMIDHNVTLISTALGGDAPSAGLYGKLSK